VILFKRQMFLASLLDVFNGAEFEDAPHTGNIASLNEFSYRDRSSVCEKGAHPQVNIYTR